MHIRAIHWILVPATLVGGCAPDAMDSIQDPARQTAFSTEPGATPAPTSEAAEQNSQALCVAVPELATWYRHSGGGPYRIDVYDVTGACDLRATVWEKQSDGSLYRRGDFPAHRELLSDGSAWTVPDPIWVGGYVEHIWLDAVDSSSVRVWIFYESLDSKPDAVEDTTYYRLPPPSDTFKPRRALSIGP